MPANLLREKQHACLYRSPTIILLLSFIVSNGEFYYKKNQLQSPIDIVETYNFYMKFHHTNPYEKIVKYLKKIEI